MPDGVDATAAASRYTTGRGEGWLEQFRGYRTGRLKRAAYALARPLLELEARRWLSSEMRRELAPAAVLRERGFPIEARRRWALAGLDVRSSVILVQGTGSGWDVLTWAPFRPRRIVATDLFPFEGWPEIARYCREAWGVECRFQQAPLEEHAFLADASVDLCVSDAVFEHCRDLSAVLAETRRVLRPGGRLYAGYGPLYYAAGGDHYSGRGGPATLYNHLLLDPAAYAAYVADQRAPDEPFQGAHRYIELDLFSRLTTRQYLAAFRDAGFALDELILELSSPALRFRSEFPERWRALVAAVADRCEADDLIVKANLVKLTRR